jgi:vacuolar-type H+-ATPase subunit C/Vma6
MNTSYIYSVSRVNTLSNALLSKTDIERLLVASAGDDLQSALKETYLAPYLLQVPNEDLAEAIEATQIEAKKLIHHIAPNGDMFRVLWIQYDVHNLRVFAKANAEGLPFSECREYLSERGVYEPEYLLEAIEADSLDFLQPGWQTAYDKAVQLVEQGEIFEVDGIFDELYFATSRQIVQKAGDSFMSAYLKTFIDLHNLKVTLRLLNNPTFNFKPTYITGGTIAESHLESKEEVLSQLANFGGAEFWKDSIEYFEATGNTTSLDARLVEYLLMFAKEASSDMFSPASLVLYYLRCRQAASNVRTIVVGKNNGMKESVLRSNLIMAYVND